MLGIFSLIWFLLGLLGFVYFHVSKWYRELNTEQTINHRKSATIRVIIYIPSVITLFLFYNQSYHWAVAALISIFSHLYIFWFLFDGLYNIFRRQPWFFKGTIDKDQAHLDAVPKWFVTMMFIISVIANTTLIYIKYHQKI